MSNPASPVLLAFVPGELPDVHAYLASVQAIHPAAQLIVVSEFPIPGYPHILYAPRQSFARNRDRILWTVRQHQLLYAALMLRPGFSWWRQRALAFSITRRLLFFNENLSHFSLHPRALPTIAKHYSWRLRESLRFQLNPGGDLHTLAWRLQHPHAFLRPLHYRFALLRGLIRNSQIEPSHHLEPAVNPPSGISFVLFSKDPDSQRALTRHIEEQHWRTPVQILPANPNWHARAAYRTTRLIDSELALTPESAAKLTRILHDTNAFASTTQHQRLRIPPPQSRDSAFFLQPEPCLPHESGSFTYAATLGASLLDTTRLEALGIPPHFEDPQMLLTDLCHRAWLKGAPTVASDIPTPPFHLPPTLTRGQRQIRQERDWIRHLWRNFSSSFPLLWQRSLWRLNLRASQQVPDLRARDTLDFAAHIHDSARPLSALDTPLLGLAQDHVACFPGTPRNPAKPLLFVVAPYLPYPLSHGGAVRMYNLMRRAARDFDQVLISFVETPQIAPPELRDICTEVVLVHRPGSHQRFDSTRPDMVEEFHRPAMQQVLDALRCRWNPDLIQYEFTQMASYAETPSSCPQLLIEHDITYDLWEQLVHLDPSPDNRLQLQHWRTFEQNCWSHFQRIVSMSAKDAARIGPRAAVLPNGVDIQRFQPSSLAPQPNRILFVGSFAHLPNLQALDFFLRDIWPLLANVTLHIIAGKNHERALAVYPQPIPLQQPGILLEGFVSDVRPAYEQASVVIAPLVASAGTNIKVLEAMAMGKAIVSTSAGINGLDVQPGHDLILENEPAAFAHAIHRLLADPALRRSLELQARRSVEQRYDWDVIAQQQAGLYRELLQTDSRARVVQRTEKLLTNS